MALSELICVQESCNLHIIFKSWGMQAIPGMWAIEDSKRFDQTNQLAFGTTEACVVVWGCITALKQRGLRPRYPTILSPSPLPSGVCKCVFQWRVDNACLDQNDLRGSLRPDHRVGVVANPPPPTTPHPTPTTPPHTHKEHKHAMSVKP